MSLSSDNLQNQLGADQPESGGDGQSGRTGDNDGNYDGGRQAGNFDASGTSTPAYRQEDGELGSREVLVYGTEAMMWQMILRPAKARVERSTDRNTSSWYVQLSKRRVR